MRRFELADAPADVLADVNRHAPIKCSNCGHLYSVKVTTRTVVKTETQVVSEQDSDDEHKLDMIDGLERAVAFCEEEELITQGRAFDLQFFLRQLKRKYDA